MHVLGRTLSAHRKITYPIHKFLPIAVTWQEQGQTDGRKQISYFAVSAKRQQEEAQIPKADCSWESCTMTRPRTKKGLRNKVYVTPNGNGQINWPRVHHRTCD